jgi:hypothetical protein
MSEFVIYGEPRIVDFLSLYFGDSISLLIDLRLVIDELLDHWVVSEK